MNKITFEEIFKYINLRQNFKKDAILLSEEDKQTIISMCQKHASLGFDIEDVKETFYEFVHWYEWKDSLEISYICLSFLKINDDIEV